jgi:hypothetical protein
MSAIRAFHSSIAVALIVVASACAPDTGTAPASLNPSAPARSLGAVGSVFTLQLRALPPNPVLPPNPIFGYGHLQMRLGSAVDNSCLPPNPITPQDGTTLITVCGKIFNEGGALYRGGGIDYADFLGEGTVRVASFDGAPPPNPCRRYDLAGAVTVPDAIAADMIVNPTLYRVNLDGDVASATTRIGGLLDGSAWGPVGTRPETDPFFAEKVCTVAITP